MMDMDTWLFFEQHPSALPIYEALEERLRDLFGEVNRRIGRTQISFANRHVFACVSFARVKRKAELPEPYLVLTLLLPFPLDSDRAAAKSQPSPGRWTTHFVLGHADEIDDFLVSLIRQAYSFSWRK